MTYWIRFEQTGKTKFGTLEDDTITVHEGNMLSGPKPTAETVALSEVKVLTPTDASQMVALWNNFHALASKFDLTVPEEPLYFLKSTSSFLAPGETIRRPRSYDGRVIFEGELGIVIGNRCREVSESNAGQYIFGYTCVNDVTAFELINKDKSFAQWMRAKSFDTFGPFGPVIATGLDPTRLTIKTLVNGEERQNYPVSDMIFAPARLVSLISRDLTLFPGDVITCGTSLGAGSMKSGNTIEVVIDGVGRLINSFE
ncbi:MAG: fumarylacetoacetate hydrolase family protein [Gammaproteobacteria bacterium]|nr:fumarylacetoacetate hydrolase family protein [Gammaproteobacteria bacterium]